VITRSLAPTIARFANEVITITRNAPSSFDANGVGVAGAASSSTAAAHVERPARPGDLAHLPEGDRVQRTCSVWTATELRHRDRVTLADGEVYEIQALEPWDALGGFWRAVGVKAQQ
jgi:hypothetical protein